MNRLQHVDATLEGRYSRKQTRATECHNTRHEDTQPFRQFIPLHYEKNYAYPLLVWLHGPTGSEFEITQVMPHVSMRNYLGLSPRGGVKHSATHPNGAATYTWDQSSQSIEWAIEDVLTCVEHAKQRFNVSSDRIFLAGSDVGGTMALRVALAEPNIFAGVASIGGAMPDTNRPLAGLLSARSMPIMLTYGRDSEQYGANRMCEDLRLLHSAGMAVSVRQYPCGQEVTTKMLSDLNVWMMERVAGVPTESPVYDDPTRLRIKDRN